MLKKVVKITTFVVDIEYNKCCNTPMPKNKAANQTTKPDI
jgi:hypothetical protein